MSNPIRIDLRPRFMKILDRPHTPSKHRTERLATITGWRFDKVDAHGRIHSPSIHEFSNAATSVPESGLRPDAVCGRSRDHEPPSPGCHCGWRLCTDIEDVVALLQAIRFFAKQPMHNAEQAYAICRVEGYDAITTPSPDVDPSSTWSCRQLQLRAVWLPPTALQTNSTGKSLAENLATTYNMPVHIAADFEEDTTSTRAHTVRLNGLHLHNQIP
jgi:hypothetical protein